MFWSRRALRYPLACILLTSLSIALPVDAAYAGNTLTCGVPVWSTPPTTDSWTQTGTDSQVVVGVNRTFGGIATELGLVNRHSGSQSSPVNIIDARSATGGAWQTSYWFHDQSTDRLWVFNQSAGNSTGQQWGYGTTFPGTKASDFSPVWSDHYHNGGSFSNPAVGTSPCVPASGGVDMEDGQAWYGFANSTNSYGTANVVNNTFSLHSKYNQVWTTWAIEQAMYLNRQVAKEGNMRLYLHGHTGSAAWTEGPLQPADDFAISHGTGGCTTAGCSWTVTGLDYAVLVYNIFGEDIAVVQNTSGQHTWIIGMDKVQGDPSCASPTNYACGDIAIHAYQQVNANQQFSLNETRKYGVEYLVGTPNQVQHMGYPY